jgi:WD repeat-containing protein 90
VSLHHLWTRQGHKVLVWLQVSDSTKKLTSGGLTASVGHDIFTDIAFEGGASVALLKNRQIFVSAVSGSVYQIDYDAHRLDAVYQLHTAGINSIAVSEGFAITGSDDKLLRIWPIDFSDHFLEAEHEMPVTSVGISPDGLQVCYHLPHEEIVTAVRCKNCIWQKSQTCGTGHWQACIS